MKSSKYTFEWVKHVKKSLNVQIYRKFRWPVSHEAVDDEVGGAVGDEQQVVHVVDGEHPGGVVGQQAHLPAVLRLVQNVDLIKRV